MRSMGSIKSSLMCWREKIIPHEIELFLIKPHVFVMILLENIIPHEFDGLFQDDPHVLVEKIIPYTI